MEPKYRLKETLKMPGKTIHAGTVKTVTGWKRLFPEIVWRTDGAVWFEEVKQPLPEGMEWVNEQKDE